MAGKGIRITLGVLQGMADSVRRQTGVMLDVTRAGAGSYTVAHIEGDIYLSGRPAREVALWFLGVGVGINFEQAAQHLRERLAAEKQSEVEQALEEYGKE